MKQKLHFPPETGEEQQVEKSRPPLMSLLLGLGFILLCLMIVFYVLV